MQPPIKHILKTIKGKDVVIIGPPASGKTYLSDHLKSDSHTVIHADDYMKHGYKEALYELMNNLKHVNGNVIVERMQGYRLLRKGIELGCFNPDIVIELQVSRERIIKTYQEERPGKDLNAMFSFVKSCETILKDYHSYPNTKKPLWLKVQNNY